MTTRSFKIHVPEEKLQRLKQKLLLADFPNAQVEDADSWAQGPPVAVIKRLAQVWAATFDWRKVEDNLNSFPQYVTPVDVAGFGTYDIHHIHMKSTRADAIPLLFLHGWPGSFIEVSKIAEDLVEGVADGPAFHLVAPSLVGFGFSSGAGSANFFFDQHAEVCDKLMLALGYNSYGDVGSLVARHIVLNPEFHCNAVHTNSPLPKQPNEKEHPDLYKRSQSTPLTKAEQAGLARAAAFAKDGDGYYKQQSTRPRTLGYSLKDSPVGLLAWLYEKMHAWSDGYAWSDEEILSWVSLYYFSRAGPDASSDVYYAMEHSEPGAFAKSQQYAGVPLGIASFANDIVSLPKLWNHTLGPIVFESEYERGGHFAAWERPDAIVADLRTMFSKKEDFGF